MQLQSFIQSTLEVLPVYVLEPVDISLLQNVLQPPETKALAYDL